MSGCVYWMCYSSKCHYLTTRFHDVIPVCNVVVVLVFVGFFVLL